MVLRAALAFALFSSVAAAQTDAFWSLGLEDDRSRSALDVESAFEAERIAEANRSLSFDRRPAWSGKVKLTVPFAAFDRDVPPLLLEGAVTPSAHTTVGVALTLRRYRLTQPRLDESLLALVSRQAETRLEVGRIFAEVSGWHARLLLGDFHVRWSHGLVLASLRATGEDVLSPDRGVTRFGATSEQCTESRGLPAAVGCQKTFAATADVRFRPGLRGTGFETERTLPSGLRWSFSALASLRLDDVNSNELRSCSPSDGKACRRFSSLIESPDSVRYDSLGATALVDAAEVLIVASRTTGAAGDRMRVGLSGLSRRRTLLGGASGSKGPDDVTNVIGADLQMRLGVLRMSCEVAASLASESTTPSLLHQGAASAALEVGLGEHRGALVTWAFGPAFVNANAWPMSGVSDRTSEKAADEHGLKLTWNWLRKDVAQLHAQFLVRARAGSTEEDGRGTASLQVNVVGKLKRSKIIEPWFTSRFNSRSIAVQQSAACADSGEDALFECRAESAQLSVGVHLRPEAMPFVQWSNELRYRNRSAVLAETTTEAQTQLRVNFTESFGATAGVRYSTDGWLSPEQDGVNVAVRGWLHIGTGFEFQLAYRSGRLAIHGREDALKHRFMLSADWAF